MREKLKTRTMNDVKKNYLELLQYEKYIRQYWTSYSVIVAEESVEC